MASYTNDSLDKLRKQDLILIVLFLQSKLDEQTGFYPNCFIPAEQTE